MMVGKSVVSACFYAISMSSYASGVKWKGVPKTSEDTIETTRKTICNPFLTVINWRELME